MVTSFPLPDVGDVASASAPFSSTSRPTKLLSLVADREAESVQKWLAKHPEVEIVSRDRGGCYVDGATWGAPQATQVADRWHILVRRIGACIDSFQRKEGLRAKDF